MTTSASTQDQRQRLWEGLLNGTISTEQAIGELRRLVPGLSNDGIRSFISQALETRKQGMQSGASWARQPTQEIQGPVQTSDRPLRYDANGNLIPNQGPLPEEENPFGAFQRGLGKAGLNVGLGGGEFGNFLRGRFAPTNAVFLAQQALSGGQIPGEEADPNLFANFAQQTRGGGLGVQAQGVFQSLINRQRGGDINAADTRLLPFLAPSGDDYGLATDLAREAARGRLGGYAASRLLPSNPELISQFRAGPTGAQNTDFLNFLRSAFGL